MALQYKTHTPILLDVSPSIRSTLESEFHLMPKIHNVVLLAALLSCRRSFADICASEICFERGDGRVSECERSTGNCYQCLHYRNDKVICREDSDETCERKQAVFCPRDVAPTPTPVTPTPVTPIPILPSPPIITPVHVVLPIITPVPETPQPNPSATVKRSEPIEQNPVVRNETTPEVINTSNVSSAGSSGMTIVLIVFAALGILFAIVGCLASWCRKDKSSKLVDALFQRNSWVAESYDWNTGSSRQIGDEGYAKQFSF